MRPVATGGYPKPSLCICEISVEVNIYRWYVHTYVHCEIGLVTDGPCTELYRTIGCLRRSARMTGASSAESGTTGVPAPGTGYR
jgi:hypothetical protein